jgi:predicted house-cleaning noncanonical NTP pyrophosphatase (MazG superfamily)
MRKFVFNKLVRDRIPDQMRGHGEVVQETVLSHEGYMAALLEKIGEEALELASATDGTLSELADLRELLDCLRDASDLTEEDIYIERQLKNRQFGSFKEHRYIGTVAIPDSSPWIERLTAQPGRYLEMKDE